MTDPEPRAETDDEVPEAWVLVVDARAVDLAAAFADGDALLEVDLGEGPRPGPGQLAHLWVEDFAGDAVPAGVYATGSVVGVDDAAATVSLGLDPLDDPVDGLVLLAGDAFVGSPLHDPAPGLVGLDAAQSAALAVDPLAIGDLATILRTPLPDPDDLDLDLDGEDDGIVLPALEVRLSDDTLLVVPGVGHDGWTVVHGDADMAEVVERPEQHRSFIDAVEFVAAAADKAGAALPVVDLDDGIEAVAIFDAEGGVYVVVKDAPDRFSFCWVDDDGTFEVVDRYASLKEALLLPVLDEELFGPD